MLNLCLVFFIAAIIAGILGFTTIAIHVAAIAKILFVVFSVLFVLAFILHLRKRL